MRTHVIQSAVTAAAVLLATFGSLAASSVIGVVSSQGRYPEAMADYALPALGWAAERWSVPVTAFGITVFVGLLLLERTSQRTASVVLNALAVAAAAGFVAALVFAAQIGLDLGAMESRRMLSQVAMSAIGASGTVFLTGTPMVVIGALLLRSWRAPRGLTEGPDAL